MTLYEANILFLEDIYKRCPDRSNRLIIALKTGANTDKDIYKHIVAIEYVKLIEEFQGDYNTLYNERVLYNVYKFLEKYFNVKFNYNWKYIYQKMSDWILRYGTWDDSLFWVDGEFWND